MLGVRLPETMDKRLGQLAKKTHRAKSYYVKEAIQTYLDAFETELIAIADYQEQKKKGTLVTHSLEEVLEELGLKKDDLED